AVAAAAVIAAGVVLAVVVVAGGGVGVGQCAPEQLGHARVGVAGAAGVKPDARLRQSHLGASADAAADQTVHTLGLEKASQRPVAAAVGGDHLGGYHGAVPDVVELEGLGVAEVTEYIPV